MSPKANIEFMVLFEFIGVLQWLSVIDLMAILPVASHTNRFGHLELECSNAAQVRQAAEKKSSISCQVGLLCLRWLANAFEQFFRHWTWNMESQSVTVWIDQLCEENKQAAEELWRHISVRLQDFAKRKLDVQT